MSEQVLTKPNSKSEPATLVNSSTFSQSVSTTIEDPIDLQTVKPKPGRGFNPPNNESIVETTKWLGLIFAPTLKLLLPTPLFEGFTNAKYPSLLDDLKFYQAGHKTRPDIRINLISEDDTTFLPIAKHRLTLETIIHKKMLANSSKSLNSYQPINTLTGFIKEISSEVLNIVSPAFLYCLDLLITLIKYRQTLEWNIHHQTKEILDNWFFSWHPFLVGVRGELFLVLYMIGQIFQKIASLYLLEVSGFIKPTSVGTSTNGLLSSLYEMAKSDTNSSNPKISEARKLGLWTNISITDNNKFTSGVLFIIKLFGYATEAFLTAENTYHAVITENNFINLSYLSKDQFRLNVDGKFITYLYDNLKKPRNSKLNEDYGFFPFIPYSNLSTSTDQTTSTNIFINQHLSNPYTIKNCHDTAVLQATAMQYTYFQILFLFKPQPATFSLKNKVFYQLMNQIQAKSRKIVNSFKLQTNYIEVNDLQNTVYGKFIQKESMVVTHTHTLYESLTYLHIMLFSWAKKDYSTSASIVYTLSDSFHNITLKAYENNISAISVDSNGVIKINSTNLPEIPTTSLDTYSPQITNNKTTTVMSLKSMLDEEIDFTTINSEKETFLPTRVQINEEEFAQNALNDKIKLIINIQLNYVKNEAQNIWRESNSKIDENNVTFTEIKSPFKFSDNMKLSVTKFHPNTQVNTISIPEKLTNEMWKEMTDSSIITKIVKNTITFNDCKAELITKNDFEYIITTFKKQWTEINFLKEVTREALMGTSGIILSLMKLCYSNYLHIRYFIK